MELQLEEVEAKYPEKVKILTSFTASWVHRVMAGADFLVMPSRSQPCRFTQLVGMRYGTVCDFSYLSFIISEVDQTLD
jgi:glycogen synthase